MSADQHHTAVQSMQFAEAAITKPLLRGWSHAVAAVGALALAVALGWQSRHDPPRLISMLVFGATLTQLYTVSAIYHIGRWRGTARRVLRSLDHSSICLMIAGTYTPICLNVLDEPLRLRLLGAIWVLAAAGVAVSIFGMTLPRWVHTSFYIGMGWVSVAALPTLLSELSYRAVALCFLAGLLYTVGAVIYARRRPDPFPRVFGFHELFHLFVIAASALFAAVIWFWVLPFPRT